MEYEPLEPKLMEQLYKDCSESIDNHIKVGEEGWFLPETYLKLSDKIRNFEVRSDDIWVLGHPRSGTTLTEEICWLIANNLDFQRATDESIKSRIIFLDLPLIYTGHEDKNLRKLGNSEEAIKNKHSGKIFELADNMKGRRVFKSHLAFKLLPKNLLTSGCKIIYVARNPKDVCVSYYNLHKMLIARLFQGNFEKFWNYFENGCTLFGPYWEHIKQGWDNKDHENVLFLFYEDFILDIRGYLSKISSFLQYNLTPEKMKALENYIRFDNLKKNKSVNISEDNSNLTMYLKDCNNQFLRNGKSGNWKSYFNPELNERADKWIEDNLKRINFTFPDSVKKVI